MYNTYKNFKGVIEGFDKEVDFENITDLVPYYRETEDIRVMAYIYVDQYGNLYNRVRKYDKLSSEDKASFILEEILKVLDDFDASRGVQLQTLLTTYVSRRCFAENQYRSRQKRAMTYNSEIAVSLDDIRSQMGQEDARFNISYRDLESLVCEDTYEIEYHNLLDSLGLNDREMEYCKIVGMCTTKPTDTEIAEELGVSSPAIHSMKKRIQKKILKGDILDENTRMAW